MKRVGWYTFIALATITILILFWQLREVVLLFLLSLAMAAAFHPLIDTFIAHKVPRGIALILSYLLVLGPLVALLILASGPLVHELELASNRLSTNYEYITANWPENGNSWQRTIAQQLPPSKDLYNWLAGDQAAKTATTLFGVTANIANFIANFSIILVLSLYWNADKVHFERLWMSLVGVDKRPQAREIWRSIESGVGAYIRSEVFQSLLAGILLWLGYRSMGLDYPVLLALFGALVWLIPWFGALIAVIPPFLVGLTISPSIGIVALGYTLLILLLEELFIEPRFFPRQNYSSVILVLVVLALADAFGLIGLILAPLLAAAIQITVRFLLQPPAAATTPVRRDFSESEREVNGLQERILKARERLSENDDLATPEISSLMERLDQLVGATDKYFSNGFQENR